MNRKDRRMSEKLARRGRLVHFESDAVVDALGRLGVHETAVNRTQSRARLKRPEHKIPDPIRAYEGQDYARG